MNRSARPSRSAHLLFALALVAFAPLAGCASDVAEDGEPVDTATAEDALTADLLTDATVEVSGKPVGAFKTVSVDRKLGLVKATFDLPASGYLFDLVATAARGDVRSDVVTVSGTNGAGAKRRIDMTGGMITEVKLPALSAKAGKKHVEVTVTFQPENIKYSPGGGKVQSPAGKASAPVPVSEWKLTIPGVPSASVTNVTLRTPKIAEELDAVGATPSPRASATLVVELSPEGLASAKKLADAPTKEGETVDLVLELRDAAGVPATVTMRTKKKPKTSTIATSSVEWVIEECFVENKHKG